MARTPSQQKMISCGSIYGSIDIDDFIRLDLKKYERLAVQGVNNSFDTVFGRMFLSFGCESPFGVVTKTKWCFDSPGPCCSQRWL